MEFDIPTLIRILTLKRDALTVAIAALQAAEKPEAKS